MLSRVLIWLWALWPAAAFAAVELDVSPQPMVVDQSARLTFKVTDGDASEPDFSVLEPGFEILGRNRQSSLKWINGRREQSTTWALDVMPRATGEVRIPALDFGAGHSPARTVRVVEAQSVQHNAVRDIVLEVDASPRAPYVQQQVIYTVRLLHRVELSSPRFSPLATSTDAIIKPLGEGRQYVERRNGVSYDAYERRYAIYPQQSGAMVIDPLVLTTQVVRGTRSLFDPFSRALQTQRVSAEKLSLEVRPVPPGFPHDATWLPARRVRLNEEWSPNEATADTGTPLSRTVFLWADGLVAGQLPEIEFMAPAGTKIYPDQSQSSEKDSNNGFTAVLQQKFAVIANAPGDIEFPPIDLPWWNVETDTLEYARLPQRTVNFVAAATDATQPGNTDGEGAVQIPITVETSTAQANGAARPWIIATGTLALAWLATLALWWSSTRGGSTTRAAEEPASDTRTASLAAASRALKRACNANDPQAARQAMLDWGRGHPRGQYCRSLRDVAALAETTAFNEALHELERVVYGPQDKSWDGGVLWRAFQHEPRPRPVENRPGAGRVELPQLFKLAGK